MENTDSFNLFVDLDDVLIDSHNSMNADLVKAYGKEYDWANTVNAQMHYDKHLKALLEKHGPRAQIALDEIGKLKVTLQKFGMSYKFMEDWFGKINSIKDDANYSVEDNVDFHYRLERMSHYFVLREKLLDVRDSKLYVDNHITDGTHAVYYENYYTRARLLANDIDRDKPQVFEQLSNSGEFKGTIKILSHYNGPNEGKAKEAFCEDCYPTGEFMPLFFHENNTLDPYFRRPRYSKARFVSENSYDITKSILIDDSMDNISTWVRAGGIGIVYDIHNRYQDTNDYYVIHNFTYNEIMGVITRIKEDYKKKKGKILVK